MIVPHVRVFHFMKHFVPLILLSAAMPIAGWAQSTVPSYAISSSLHYHESGVPDGVGESEGSAVITARALLGKDHITTVELTTGTLDSSTTPPGSFANVRLQPLTPSGVALFSQYFSHLATSTGYYSFSWPSLYRGEQIKLRSYVTGFPEDDPVTVSTTVKLRPDLTVQGLTFPETAIVQQMVNIRAHITELNGDYGATTACMLGIDGNTVDQANNVYVAAGGGVTCEFSYPFSGAGTHSIEVTAANPVPGDWDLSNNTTSGTITISTDNAEHGIASFLDSHVQASATQTAQVTYQGSTVFNYSKTIGTSVELQAASTQLLDYGCTGATNAVSWQVPVDISYTESMDGTQMIGFTDTGLNATATAIAVLPFPVCNSTAASVVNQYGVAFFTDHFDYIGSTQYLDSAGNPISSLQWVGLERGAGDVTYFSSGYQCSWWNNCSNTANYYAWNTSTHSPSGTLLPVGSTWGSSIASKDASGNTLAGILSVPITTVKSNAQPSACASMGPDSFGYTYNNCSSANVQTSSTFGITAQ
jgi:hypothetical protein